MTSNFVHAPSYVAKLEAFLYGLTGFEIPLSDLTLTALGMVLVILCLRAPMFDNGR